MSNYDLPTGAELRPSAVNLARNLLECDDLSTTTKGTRMLAARVMQAERIPMGLAWEFSRITQKFGGADAKVITRDEFAAVLRELENTFSDLDAYRQFMQK